MSRPFLHEFMCEVYKYYDIVIWSQTSWKWVEMKCTQLGLLTSQHFKLCFVLDRSSMFSISSIQKDGKKCEHEVKALQIIWSKFSHLWGPHNTLHADDVEKNFALNPKNGIKVSTYRTNKEDTELLLLQHYLIMCAKVKDVTQLDHKIWRTAVNTTSTSFIFQT